MQPNDVDAVISTHLHHDHVGWHTTYDFDNVLRPTFRRARYLVTKVEYDYFTAMSASGRRGDSFEHIRDSVIPLMASGQLSLVEPDTVIEEGIRLVAAPGHTPGHGIIEVTGGGRTALLVGDVAHHPLQINDPTISSAMCSDPAVSAATRERVLAEAARTEAVVFASHLPLPIRVRARSSGSGYDYEELGSLRD